MLVKKVLSIVLTLAMVFTFNLSVAKADEDAASADEKQNEIAQLKTQVQELLGRIEKLEQEQVKTKEDVKKVETAAGSGSRVDLANALAKLKLKGRWAAGFFDSGKAGSFPSGSFEVPEAKIQFAFQPDGINNIILRFNLNNATFNNVDYLYVDSDLKKLLNLSFPISSRLGRMKVDFGEETWGNNSVESVLPSASAANINGNDEGFQLSGKLGKTKPVNYAISVTNGNAGTGSDISNSKAFAGKLSYNIIEPLYISASYYNSGQMRTANSEIGIGTLVSRPNSALKWERKIWEVDLRYDFGKGKTLNPPAFSDSLAFIRLSYGGFNDDASGGSASGRDGAFGFIEGAYNLTKKFYVASRASFIDLDGSVSVTLNGVSANLYRRYSLGGGYCIGNNTILKLGYDLNRESGDADNNLFSTIIATQF